jgi:vacuolar iron transporter family protein
MSDGLTVPFALAAGLSGAVDTTAVVIMAGLAEVAAGSIAMGLGGYLAARTDAEHYATERATEVQETVDMPDKEAEEVALVLP